MKKKLIVLFIIFIIAAPLFAADSRKDEKGLRIDGGIGYTSSIHSSFVSLNPELLYDFGLFAAGVGVNTLLGLTFSDIYMAPYAQLELGWLYLAGGTIFEVKPPDPASPNAPDGYITADDETPLLPYVVLGADFVVVPIGKGGIGLDLSAGFMPTASPVQIMESSDNFLTNIIGSLISSLISATFDSVKGGASIYYSHIF